jgi:hypothetical protein
MKLRSLLVAALALVASVAVAPAQSQTSQSNCTLAGCIQAYTQNGIQSFVRTFKASLSNQLPAAAATDFLTITGSSTRTVRVTKIVVSGAATSAGSILTAVIRRGAVDTTVGATLVAVASRDTQNGGNAAALNVYTVNPTLGNTASAGAGTLDTCRLFLQTATAGSPDVCAFTYGVNDDQLTVLRGTTDQLAVNLQGSTIPSGGTIDIDVEWTEE